ncbi:MAG TPA: hypothetical protein VGX23_18390 [Actinocrinis sp.]|nr:hypothetical protein [Actinocrinis sp.]
MSKDAELLVLRHENTVLRRQITKMRYEPTDRFWVAAPLLAHPPPAPGRGVPRLVARKWDYTAQRRPGRPSITRGVEKIIIDMAADNPFRGHPPQSGRADQLGHPIAASTVWQILHDAGVGPSRRRQNLHTTGNLTATPRSRLPEN